MAWLAGCVAVLMFGALTLAFLVVAFYAEEDWRGTRAWDKARADLQTQGENLDPAEFFPPLVPDTGNFGTLPYFKEVMIADSLSGKMNPRLAITQQIKGIADHPPSAFVADTKPDSLPYLGFWQKGETPEVGAVRRQMVTFGLHQNPAIVFSNEATPAAMFGRICPVLADLRRANATHPDCRFNRDYGLMNPAEVRFGPDIDQIRLNRLLAYDGRLAILSHLPAQVLADLKVTWKIHSGLHKEALLISGLIDTGVVAVQLPVVAEALADHLLDDRQLQELDDDLGKINPLSDAQFYLRGEMVLFAFPTLDDYSSHRLKWMKDTLKSREILSDESTQKTCSIRLSYRLIPQGWFDEYKAIGASKIMVASSTTDPAAHRVYPERLKALVTAPTDDISYRWIDSLGSSAHFADGEVKKASLQQAQLDEARISCRLERYRLAHGVYPATLEKLVPTYGADLPRDIMNGEPYHYKLNADQTYLLYSVGWDQKDDGGDAGKTRNTDSPDWIWTNYPNQVPKK